MNELKIPTFLESLPDSVLVVTRDGKIVMVNQTAEFMFAKPRQELLNMNVSDLGTDFDLNLCIDRKSEFNITFNHQTSESPRFLSLKISQISGDKTGKIAQKYICVFRDVTEKLDQEQKLKYLHIQFIKQAKKLEEINDTLEKKIAQKTAEAENRAKELEQARFQNQHFAKMAALGEMAGGMAHEINTPLGSILLCSQCIEDSLKSEPIDRPYIAEMVRSIGGTVERISKIVKSLQAFSRKENNAPFLEVRLLELIDGVSYLCVEKYRAKNIELIIDRSRLDNLNVLCHTSEIAQVLLNLLNNASDAVEGLEQKWVKIETRDRATQVEIIIKDSGLGISKQVQEKMFFPFFTTKEVGKGTGLGLSISKGIIESHGGTLIIDNQCKNTTFVITLPKGL